MLRKLFSNILWNQLSVLLGGETNIYLLKVYATPGAYEQQEIRVLKLEKAQTIFSKPRNFLKFRPSLALRRIPKA
jgi:hypothetical protein